MKFSEDLKGLLLLNTLIAAVWLNEDGSVWYTSEKEGFTEFSREEVINGKTAKAPKAPKEPKEEKAPVIEPTTDDLGVEETEL